MKKVVRKKAPVRRVAGKRNPLPVESLFSYNVTWSEEDHCFISSVLEIPGLQAHGDSHEKALKEIMTVTAFTLKLMKEDGDIIPEPLSTKKFSGKFTLRMSTDVHRQLALSSAAAGVSLNSFIINKAVSE